MTQPTKSQDPPTNFIPINSFTEYPSSQEFSQPSPLTVKKQPVADNEHDTYETKSYQSNSSNMKNPTAGHVIQIPISSAAYLAQSSRKELLPGPPKVDSTINRMHKRGERADNIALGIREHVRLGPKITETLKGKLSLGAKILQAGGVAKILKQNFSVREGEKLLKASQCYLSTTAGPIAGLLFISTDKVAFRSERSIKISSPTGEQVRIHYKVSIPLRKIKRANESENVERPSRKYIEIVTVDKFDFWFMGFLNYQKTFSYIQQAISQTQ